MTLVVSAVTQERLQAITKDDVIAEGITSYEGAPIEGMVTGWYQPYAQLWDKLNPGVPWDSNPKIYVIEFETYRCNIDSPGAPHA